MINTVIILAAITQYDASLNESEHLTLFFSGDERSQALYRLFQGVDRQYNNTPVHSFNCTINAEYCVQNNLQVPYLTLFRNNITYSYPSDGPLDLDQIMLWIASCFGSFYAQFKSKHRFVSEMLLKNEPYFIAEGPSPDIIEQELQTFKGRINIIYSHSKTLKFKSTRSNQTIVFKNQTTLKNFVQKNRLQLFNEVKTGVDFWRFAVMSENNIILCYSNDQNDQQNEQKNQKDQQNGLKDKSKQNEQTDKQYETKNEQQQDNNGQNNVKKEQKEKENETQNMNNISGTNREVNENKENNKNQLNNLNNVKKMKEMFEERLKNGLEVASVTFMDQKINRDFCAQFGDESEILVLLKPDLVGEWKFQIKNINGTYEEIVEEKEWTSIQRVT
ncbi:Thioredoxin-like_superfamily [Hexamita inflata]|uniref:Thioredoxin-like superfamily n=1 Tax=Hexamita inflata TaxID=28002 RepID=A0AA86UQ47_9EUKA|nr:Thioredoxin-like superfamily [Hexamita inflata]